MERERWNQISALLTELLELPAAARAARLASSTTDDPELAYEVASLLEAHESAESDFLADLDPERLRVAIRGSEAVPERIGAWRIVDKIGEGGMGVVYDAVREDGQFEQRSALKLIQRGFEDDPLVERFLRERQILARMEHPGVARILDGGLTDDGEPWFAMERVEGVALDTYCDERSLSLDERLRLFLEVCEIVQYAHGNLVVHRDLKPSNILMTEEGAIKLLDFGIAKHLLSDAAGEGPRAEPRWLTPSYAAPEQLRGETITTAADVYALGVILHELLSGERPFVVEGENAGELAESVETSEAPRPSRRVTDRAAAVRGSSSRDLRRALQGDLDAVVAKALELDTARRYSSVETLGDDVCRFLENRSVRARPATPFHTARLFLRRHRAAAISASLVLLSILTGLGVSVWQAQVAARERDHARLEAEQSEQVRRFVVDLFRGSNPASPTELSAQDLIERGLERVRSQLGDRPDLEQELLSAVGEMAISLGDYATAETVLDEALRVRVGGRPRDQIRRSNILHLLGEAHILNGEPARSITEHQSALALREEFAPQDEIAIAESYNYVAVAFASTENLVEAEDYYRRAIAIYDRLGEESVDTLNTRQNLAITLRLQNDYEGARELLSEVVTIAGERFPEKRAAMSGYLDALAVAERRLGRSLAAAPLARRSVEMSIELWGEDHPDSRLRMNNAAMIEHALGRYEETEPLLRKVLYYDLEQLGTDHIYVAQTRSNLGATLLEQGRITEALELFAEADPVIRAGRSTNLLVSHLARYSRALLASGDADRAQRMSEETIELLDEGQNTMYSRRALVIAGTVVQALGRYAEAELYFRRALEQWETATVRAHPNRASALVGLAGVRLAAGPRDKEHLVETREMLEEAAEILVGSLPETHYQIAACRALLARQRIAEGEAEQGSRELQLELRALEHRLGIDHWRLHWIRSFVEL